MTGPGSVYGQALYDLAAEENLTAPILEQMRALADSFRAEPDFIRLLSSPTLSKEERCGILDDSFRGHIHIYLLNFLKLLTERGYMRAFNECFRTFTENYYADNNMLEVTAVTAVPLTEKQRLALTDKLTAITGKTILLQSRVDPACLGGMRLDYDGQRLDDTVSHRLEDITNMLKNTVL